jgi:hypothetical protein
VQRVPIACSSTERTVPSVDNYAWNGIRSSGLRAKYIAMWWVGTGVKLLWVGPYANKTLTKRQPTRTPEEIPTQHRPGGALHSISGEQALSLHELIFEHQQKS